MKVTPIADYIHIRKPRTQEGKTAGGIILPVEQQQTQFQGTVLAVGPDVKMVKVGQVIIYKQYSSNKVPDTELEYLVKEEDLLAIIG